MLLDSCNHNGEHGSSSAAAAGQVLTETPSPCWHGALTNYILLDMKICERIISEHDDNYAAHAAECCHVINTRNVQMIAGITYRKYMKEVWGSEMRAKLFAELNVLSRGQNARIYPR